jgi:hypothetical protein
MTRQCSILCGKITVIERENNVRGLTGEAKNFLTKTMNLEYPESLESLVILTTHYAIAVNFQE